jgi:hypothetical protein
MHLPIDPARIRRVRSMLQRWFRQEPGPPEDPFAYVGTPKKPLPPHLKASAVAELPDDPSDGR